MKHGIPRAMSILPLVAVLAGTGHAAGTLTLGDATSPSGISGYSGTKKTVDPFYAVKEIYWEEDKDDPCSITVEGRILSKPEEGKIANYNLCKGSGGNRKKVALTASGNYGRGVAVCTTDKKDSADNKLKGIKLYAAEVKSDGKVVTLNTYEKNEHTNCAKWHKAVYCPAGHVMNGVHVYSKDTSFTGLGIKCAKVTTTGVTLGQPNY